MSRIISLLSFIVICSAYAGCKTKKEKPAPPPPVIRKEKSDSSAKQKGPIINVIDTVEYRRTVLCVKDSAATAAGLSLKLSNIYNVKIPGAIKTGKLKTAGQPMAWYKTQKPPFFFEAGIPVEKAPAKAIKGFYIKNTGGDSALVAHFFGPNELSTVGYDALNEILKERKKKKAAPAYEIYVKNPFEQSKEKRDPYKMQTDIVVPY
ncbi:MAG: hypothetical protein WKF88_04640 [Ferruginibacter sp.]